MVCSQSTSLLILHHTFLCAGDAVAHIEAAGLGPKIIPLVQVFARVSPEQKELVIKTLRAAGRVTLMCGDGTNDVGGLKAAHVGVALLAPSEMADKVRKARAAGDKKGDKKQKGGAGASNQGVNAEGARGAAREVMLLDKQGKKSKGGKSLSVSTAHWLAGQCKSNSSIHEFSLSTVFILWSNK